MKTKVTRPGLDKRDLTVRLHRIKGQVEGIEKMVESSADSSDVLVRLARSLTRSVAKGGTLVTSGVNKRGRPLVLAAFAGEGLRLSAERRAGEWFAFAHRKP